MFIELGICVLVGLIIGGTICTVMPEDSEEIQMVLEGEM